MNCIGCNKEIDYVKERKPKAYNFGTTEKHVCESFGQKKSFSSGKARPIGGELELLGKISGVEARVDTLEQAVKALVDQVNRMQVNP